MRQVGLKRKSPEKTKTLWGGESSPFILIAKMNKDLTLSLNGLSEVGTVDHANALSRKLLRVFAERSKNNVLNESMLVQQVNPGEDPIQKTVFIRAPRGISFGQVVKVIDVVKGAGANPISLQMDDLEQFCSQKAIHNLCYNSYCGMENLLIFSSPPVLSENDLRL